MGERGDRAQPVVRGDGADHPHVGGLYPFLAGAAAGGAALVCIHRRWRIGFGLALLASLGFSPLAFALLMAVLAAALLGQPRPGAALRRHRAAFAAVVAVFVVAVLMERAFPSGAWYPYDLTDAAIVLGFSLAGLYITGSSPRARSLRMLFACYLALNLVAFLLKGPIGSNSSRLFVIAGAPLLWLAANVSRERSRLVVLPVLAAALALQVGPFVRDAYSSWGDPASEAAYWKPAEHLLASHADPEHRVEVVATRGHWEAYYLAKHGIPLARGWYRQDDFPQNGPLYSDDLTGRMYRHWLRSLGVHYVLLSDADLDYSATHEAALLRSGAAGLTPVAHTEHWTMFALRHPTPIVTPPPGAKGRLIRLAQGRVTLWTSAPGRYLVRVRSSPYWVASPSLTCVGSSADGMTTVTTPTGGYVSLTIRPALEQVAETVGGGATPGADAPNAIESTSASSEDGMASTTEFTASCALCRRHLLVGEPARLYQDPSSKRFAKVCPLCYERAERRGWRADGRPIVAVHANPPADQACCASASRSSTACAASCSQSSSTSTRCETRSPRPSSRPPSCAARSAS